MANARHKNTIFVDSTGDITVDGVKPVLWGVLITPSAAGAVRLVIKESSSGGTTKVDLRGQQFSWTESTHTVTVSDLADTKLYDFSPMGGIDMTTTFNITTITNCTAILIGDWYLKTG